MSETKPAGTVRQRLLRAADELFYREGVHTVGIDRVLEHAGVAKASLYSTFGSKEELVRAYLEERVRELKERTERRISGIDDPRERILAVFDGLADRVAQGAYYGCPFMRACAEGPPGPSAARDVASAYRTWRHELFAHLAKEAGSRNPDTVARQLSMIYDGAAVGVAMDDDPDAAVAARSAAERLLGEHVKSAPKKSRRA
jgi:AcrR family transcriptional regulator